MFICCSTTIVVHVILVSESEKFPFTTFYNIRWVIEKELDETSQ